MSARRSALGVLIALAPVTGLALHEIEVQRLPPLPAPVANNAVATWTGPAGTGLVSVLGLGPGKTWKDITAAGHLLAPGGDAWQALPALPVAEGRLAASAVSVGDSVLVLGGYTVAADGHEVSTPEVFRMTRPEHGWRRVADMPVPVDDAVAGVYRDRWVYLVSGWHDLGNVNLVQVLDTRDGTWAQATPYPGEPVFGHAGALSGDSLVVCDGVRIEYSSEGGRTFLPANQCWSGSIDPGDVRRIDWRPLGPHPGPSRYRMASGVGAQGRVVFVGGSANPYNFDGVGYDGRPSEPEDLVFTFDPESGEWACHGRLAVATMDHRGLPEHDGWLHLIGGMRAGQQVSAEVLKFRLPPAASCHQEAGGGGN